MIVAAMIANAAQRLSRRLHRDRQGIAMVEFAIVMPFFIMFGMWGIELAFYQLQIMKVEQLASHVADNASRIGDYSTLENRKIYESDIDDLLVGADLQAGTQMKLLTKGRIIISSLEVNSGGKQYIHWQRCAGLKQVQSSYGKQGDVLTPGMGPKNREVAAQANDAVMFVEVQYDYQPLISKTFIGNPTISSIASFTVRSSRDLLQVYQGATASPVMGCSRYTSTIS